MHSPPESTSVDLRPPFIARFLRGLLTFGFLMLGLAPALAEEPERQALLVVKPGALRGDDASILARLEALGFEVEVQRSNRVTSTDATGQDLVVVSSSAKAQQVRTTFRDVSVPVVTWQPLLFDDLGMTESSPGIDFGEAPGATIEIVDPGHFLAAGLSGAVTVVDASDGSPSLHFGAPNDAAFRVATLPGEPSKATVFGYETGAAMPGLSAPGRRVGLFLDDRSGQRTAEGWALLDAALIWAVSQGVDTTAPELEIEAPETTPVVGDPSPRIVLTYSDAGRGLDFASLVVSVNSIPVTSTCAIGGRRAECATPRLAAGSHQIAAEIADLEGNATTARLDFDLVLDPPEPGPPTVEIQAPTPDLPTNATSRVVTGIFTGDAVTLDVNGVPATLVGEVFTATVPLAEGANAVTATVTNDLGTARDMIVLVVDTTPPALTLEAPGDDFVTSDSTVEVRGTVADDGAVVLLEVAGEPVVPEADGSFVVEVPLLLGDDDLVVSAQDRVGNFSTIERRIRRGAAPAVTVETPQPGAVLRTTTVEVRGTFEAALEAPTTVTVEGQSAEIGPGATFRARVPLEPGANLLRVVASNLFGSTTEEILVEHRRRPTITLDSPANDLLTAAQTVRVQGTVERGSADAGPLTVTVGGVPATLLPGTPTLFEAEVPLAEGRNALVAVATDASGETATATLRIHRDTTPPRLTLVSPSPGATLTRSTVAVVGSFRDLSVAPGDAPPTVEVEGRLATLEGDRFLLPDLELVPGPNPIRVVGTDTAGNVATLDLSLTFDPAVGAGGLQVVAGDLQTGTVGQALSVAPSVELRDLTGQPRVGAQIVFRVTESDGLVGPAGEETRARVVTTDALGQASVRWTLGTRAGAGNQRLEASVVGGRERLAFLASATPDTATVLLQDSGAGQIGTAGETLPLPLTAAVTDAHSNRLPGVPVTFTVVSGDGTVVSGDGTVAPGATTQTIVTGADGVAAAALTLGFEEGRGNHQVVADFEGNPGGPVKFSASALQPGDPAETQVSGRILDPTDQPIAGVTVRLLGTDRVTESDADGRFVLTPAPVGRVLLDVDGSTADRPGTWPHLEYELFPVAGRDTTVGGPIFLLPLDVEAGLAVDATRGGVLEVPDLPGLTLEVAPGAATFPDGSKEGVVSVTAVRADKVPMTPNFGQQPRLVVTIQPSGTVFDPPAVFTMPNLEGLPAGQVNELVSFDHDQFRFVTVGTGVVSEDGLQIRSSPGTGIVEGGWHAVAGPQPSGDCCQCTECQQCDPGVGACVADDTKTPSNACQTTQITLLDNALEPVRRTLNGIRNVPFVARAFLEFTGGLEVGVSLQTCPLCCGGNELETGTQKVTTGAKVTAALGLELNPFRVPGFQKDFNLFGFDVSIDVVPPTLTPFLSGAGSVDLGVNLEVNRCLAQFCYRVQGCGNLTGEVGIEAKTQVQVLVGDRGIDVEISARAFGQAQGVLQAGVGAGELCPRDPGNPDDGPGFADACLGDVTGNVMVQVLGFSSQWQWKFLEGDPGCGC